MESTDGQLASTIAGQSCPECGERASVVGAREPDGHGGQPAGQPHSLVRQLAQLGGASRSPV